MYRKFAEQEMSSRKLKVVLFLGSTREGRMGLRVAKFVQGQLESKNFDVELFGKWI